MEVLKKFLTFTFFFITLLSVLKVFLLGLLPDFGVYYAGSNIFLNGQNIYLSQKDLFSNYVYPPFVLLFFSPFTLISLQGASILWTFLSFCFFVFSIYLISKLHKQKVLSNRMMLFAAFSFLFFPTKFTLGMGQMNMLILLLFVYATLCFIEKKNIKAGLLFGLSLALKFFPVPVLLFFLLKRQFTIFFTAIGTFFVLYCVTYFLVGKDIFVIYFTQIFPGIFSSAQTAYYNQALSGVIARFSLDPIAAGYSKLLLFGVLTCVSFYFVLKASQKTSYVKFLVISLLTTLSLLVHSFSWQHHFVWLLLPFSIVLSKEIKWTNKMIIWLGVSYALVALNVKDNHLLPMLLQSHVFFGTLMLWLFLIFLLYQKANDK